MASNKKRKINSFDVTSGSHKIVWWQCEKGHEWKNEVHFRIRTAVLIVVADILQKKITY